MWKQDKLLVHLMIFHPYLWDFQHIHGLGRVSPLRADSSWGRKEIRFSDRGPTGPPRLDPAPPGSTGWASDGWVGFACLWDQGFKTLYLSQMWPGKAIEGLKTSGYLK